jgi:hypothetical protein
MGFDFILEHTQKLELSAAPFQQYVTTVLIWFIDILGTNNDFTGEPAISLMDNCSIDTRPGVPTALREHNVKGIIFPPRTTETFQALGLSLLGVFKKKMQQKLPFTMTIQLRGSFKRFFTI